MASAGVVAGCRPGALPAPAALQWRKLHVQQPASGFLLLLLCERPGHGYDLVQRLDGLGVIGIEGGPVYRCLRALEQRELVVSAWLTPSAGPTRRTYVLTAAGQDDLQQSMNLLTRLGRVVGSCLDVLQLRHRTAGESRTS